MNLFYPNHSKRSTKRKTHGRYRRAFLGIETLEDRTLLAAQTVLDLVPDTGTISVENGTTVVTVDESTTIKFTAQVNEAAAQMRLLQHQSLTNWVLAQRSILHLSQLLEIIATGGQLQPTYGRGDSPTPSGALVDKEA